jgi:SAM-dependent methyltransferase
MLARATRTIERLRRPKRESAWIDYESTKSHYSQDADRFKESFVRNTLRQRRPHTVWDLGCNTGQFSIIASEVAKHVIAMDSDEPSVDALYRRVRAGGHNILPLVMDLANPSPDQGWAQTERRGLTQRGTADVALCLALIHHIAIGGNVPFGRFADWLASFARCAIIEFVPKTDPMVQRLFLTRKDVYPQYTQQHFEAALTTRFSIAERAPIPENDRVLYAIARR